MEQTLWPSSRSSSGLARRTQSSCAASDPTRSATKRWRQPAWRSEFAAALGSTDQYGRVSRAQACGATAAGIRPHLTAGSLMESIKVTYSAPSPPQRSTVSTHHCRYAPAGIAHPAARPRAAGLGAAAYRSRRPPRATCMPRDPSLDGDTSHAR